MFFVAVKHLLLIIWTIASVSSLLPINSDKKWKLGQIKAGSLDNFKNLDALHW